MSSAPGRTNSADLSGELHIIEISFVAAAGTFAMGIVAGIVAVVSHGIRREQKRYWRERRLRDEHGIWAAPDAPLHFLAEEAPGVVGCAARRLSGLYVHHLPPSARHDGDLGARV
jgi:hypothetical protein